MKHLLVTLTTLLLVPLGSIAYGQTSNVTITITPTLAPNAFGSPSFDVWQQNSVYALENGLSSYGDPTQPTYYSPSSTTLPVSDNVVTNFSSWLGTAEPGGADQNEYGNRLTFGVVINGNGGLISLSELGFSANSSDPYDTLAFSYDTGSYDYNDAYVGVIWGTGGNANTYVTSGDNTQLVNEIIGRGSANAWEALTGYPQYWPGPTEQDMIDQVPDAYDLPVDFTETATYTFGDTSASSTINFYTPDSVSSLSCLSAAATLLLALRRRKTAV